MKHYSFIEKSISAFGNALFLHLFITALLLPFIIRWGLPFSPLAGFATLVFSPFLSLFLLISSLMFFLELFQLPTFFLSTVLEYLTSYWHQLLSIPVKGTLVGFPLLSGGILLTFGIATCMVIHHPVTAHPLRGALVLCCLIAGLFLISSLFITREKIITISFHDKPVTFLLPCAEKRIMIDQGGLGSRKSSPSWVHYTLIPELIKKTGSLTITDCICLKPTLYSLTALEVLIQYTRVERLYLPAWQGHISRRTWQVFKSLQYICDIHNTRLILMKKSSFTVFKDHTSHLCLRAEQEKIPYHDAFFNSYKGEGFIDNKQVSFYASKRISS